MEKDNKILQLIQLRKSMKKLLIIIEKSKKIK